MDARSGRKEFYHFTHNSNHGDPAATPTPDRKHRRTVYVNLLLSNNHVEYALNTYRFVAAAHTTMLCGICFRALLFLGHTDDCSALLPLLLLSSLLLCPPSLFLLPFLLFYSSEVFFCATADTSCAQIIRCSRGGPGKLAKRWVVSFSL